MRSSSLILTTALLLSAFQSSYSCEQDQSQPAAQALPKISVETNSATIQFQFRGDLAQKLYEHLQGPAVQTRMFRHHTTVKTGFGLACQKQQRHRSDSYNCQEVLSTKGELRPNFPFQDELKLNSQLLRLKMQSPALNLVFDQLDGIVNQNEFEDGSYAEYKNGPNLSCIRYVSVDNQAVVVCEQLLSSDGYARGTGTDPMIGSGTQPILLEITE